jgi:hypothetical protein
MYVLNYLENSIRWNSIISQTVVDTNKLKIEIGDLKPIFIVS